jgi:hypothetical protein
VQLNHVDRNEPTVKDILYGYVHDMIKTQQTRVAMGGNIGGYTGDPVAGRPKENCDSACPGPRPKVDVAQKKLVITQVDPVGYTLGLRHSQIHNPL